MNLNMAGICLVPLLKRLKSVFSFYLFQLCGIVCHFKPIWGSYRNYRRRNWERKVEGLTPSHPPGTLLKKINEFHFFNYLFNPRISQHLTSSIISRRKERRHRVTRSHRNPVSPAAPAAGGTVALQPWGGACAQGKGVPSGFQWLTSQKPPQPCARSSAVHTHRTSQGWDPTVSAGGKEKRERGERGLFPPPWLRRNDNPPSSPQRPLGREGGAWTYRFANHKVLHKYKAWVSHWTLTPNTIFLRLPGVFAVVSFMILPGSVLLHWDSASVILSKLSYSGTPVGCGTAQFGRCCNVPATEGSYQALVWVYRLTAERCRPPCSPKEAFHPDPNPQPGLQGWTRFCSDPLLPEPPWF